MRDVEQEEPHLAWRPNEEQEKDAEERKLAHADVVEDRMELIQEHLEFNRSVQLLEWLLDLLAIWKQDFGHLYCLFWDRKASLSNLLTYQL